MLKLKSVDLKQTKVSTLAIPVCEDKALFTDPDMVRIVDQALSYSEFKGRKDDAIVLYDLPGTRIDRALFLGIGKFDKIDLESLRALSGKAVKQGIGRDLSELAIAVPPTETLSMKASDRLVAMAEGALLANHIFDRYKQEKKKKPLKNIFLFVPDKSVRKYAGLTARVSAVCRATLQAREWIDTPANDKRPEQFARMIVAAAEKMKLDVTVLDEKALKRQKFGALLAVAQGSNSKPRLVVLKYAPKGAKRTVALVGKGVTFDAGGINLKPTGSIETMKTDMSGAAAVAATMMAAAAIKPKIKLIGVLPIVENMPSGSATRPSDIVTTYAGKTVEVGNTDAEGRLILVDALAYVIKKNKPETVIDLATLTGACVVALGEKIAGVFSNDRELTEAVVASGERTHERCWPMPLPEDYRELLKSDVADLSNISGGRWGGAITAALFLKDFVGDTRWAHLDIAGPARAGKASDYCTVGGTGFGVRLLCDLLGKL